MTKATILIIAAWLAACQSSPRQTPEEIARKDSIRAVDEALRQKHSGVYEIVVRGYSGSEKEFYELDPGGSATWVFRHAGGSQSKSGRWSATEREIWVYFRGNTGGVIDERFQLAGTRFVSTGSKDRYLKRTR